MRSRQRSHFCPAHGVKGALEPNMKIFHYLDAIFVRLSVIPGLGFLHDYVEELETQQTRRQQLANTYRGYGRALRDAGKAAKDGGHHGHEEGHDKSDEHEGHGKRAKRGGPPARPGRGGQVARKAREKEAESDDLDEDLYEDDDFESYLQH
jgi:hypothetical protein